MRATSRAVVCWFSAGRPVQLTKFVLAMPSSDARSFMRSTNSAALPAMCSASATAESFALPTITLLSSSPTG